MNHIYIGDRELEPQDPYEDISTRCTYCRVASLNCTWRANHGNCPLCQKAFVGMKNED